MKRMHKGVGVIIGNKESNKFFVQKKDEKYQIKKWINAFSFWGGEVEKTDKTPFEALIRELTEELGSEFIYDKSEIKFIDNYIVKSEPDFSFNLFELLLATKDFENLTNLKINEGSGTVQNKDSLLTGVWVWGLEEVIKNYFELNNSKNRI